MLRTLQLDGRPSGERKGKGKGKSASSLAHKAWSETRYTDKLTLTLVLLFLHHLPLFLLVVVVAKIVIKNNSSHR